MAEEALKQICQDLLDQGIWPPYTLIIKDGPEDGGYDDGYGDEIHLDVTLESFRPADTIPCDGTIEIETEMNFKYNQ